LCLRAINEHQKGEAQMKTIINLSLLVVSLTTMVSSVFGQTTPAEANPALRYYRAFLLAPDVSESDMDYLASNNLWSVTLPTQFGDLVARYDPEFKLVRQAGQLSGPCDWGIDFSQGPNTLLPQLARCKGVMVGARYRVAWHLQNGRQEEARDDLLAAFVLARNISRDGTLISVLVQIAAESIGADIIAENFGKFTPQTLEELVRGIDAAPTEGTAAASIAFERIAFHGWFLNKIEELQRANPGNEPKVMAGIRDLLVDYEGHEPEDSQTPGPRLWERIARAGGNTSDGIVRLLRQEDLAYDRLAKIMALPFSQFGPQAKPFAAEFDREMNPMIARGLTAYLKARQREFRLQTWMAMVHAAVEYRLHGESGLLSVKDPCGQGPFSFERFMFEGADRGLRLESEYHGSGFPEVMIFVDKGGRPFFYVGPYAGKGREQNPGRR
jgi:hypothetical protein